MRNYITILMVIICVAVNAQIKIQGKVIDFETLNPIASANISLPDANITVTSSEDGTFYIESSKDAKQLKITKDGYEIADFVIEKKIDNNFEALLYPKEESEKKVADNVVNKNEKDNTATPTPKSKESKASVTLKAVELAPKKKVRLKKKENPAYAILKEVWKHKKKDGLASTPQFQYNEYEKIQFDINNIDSAFTKRKIFRGMEFIFDKVDTSSVNGRAFLPAFINESIYKVSGINKPKTAVRKELLANKTSGFEDNVIVTTIVKSIFRDINIYDNRVILVNKNFVSPIATDGFAVYDYELKDTVDIDGVETYKIKYYPRRDGELTFKGDLYISRKNYAVKEVVMETTKQHNMNFVRKIFMDLNFDIPNDSVFYPKKQYAMLDISLGKKETAKGIFAHKTLDYYNYDFETRHPNKYYHERLDPSKGAINDEPDGFWEENRPEKLSKNEKGVYEMLDRLNEVPKYKRIVKIMEVLGSGYYNVGNSIDIGNLANVLGRNKIEGYRLRLGARTFFSQNDLWRVQGYLAYGFKDRKFKFAADFRYMFNTINRFQIGIGTKRDIEQLGASLTTADGIMTRSFASSSIISQGNNAYLSNNNLTNIYASVEPWKNILLRADANFQYIEPADSKLFSISYLKDGIIKDNLRNSRISLSILAKPGARYRQFGIDRGESRTFTPTFFLRYTKGLKGVFDSDFEYDKLQFLYNQPILIGSFGRTSITVEAGKTFQGVPLSLLSAIPGNQSLGQINGTFALLNYYEFVTDQYVIMNWQHFFNGWILNKIPLIRLLKFREIGFIRAGYGSISKASMDMNRSSVIYSDPNMHIYFEYGFGIENIGFGNFRPFQINFNWRGNYRDHVMHSRNPKDGTIYTPNKTNNFGVTFGLKFSL